MNEIITEALALRDQRFDDELARAEAFEALRERVEDDDDEALFDLALIEAQAHSAHRDGRALAGEPADIVLTAWARVVGGVDVPSREDALRAAMGSLAEQLADKTLDGSPEVAASTWLALASRALRAEALDTIRATIACAHRALAGVHGSARGETALVLLELASHADDADAASDASERLWALREHDELDIEDRFQFVAPVWQVRMAVGDAEGAKRAAEALVALAREGHRREREADALAALAECAMAQGDLRAARDALSRRIAIAEALLSDTHEGARAFALARRDEAQAAMTALEALARDEA